MNLNPSLPGVSAARFRWCTRLPSIGRELTRAIHSASRCAPARMAARRAACPSGPRPPYLSSIGCFRFMRSYHSRLSGAPHLPNDLLRTRSRSACKPRSKSGRPAWLRSWCSTLARSCLRTFSFKLHYTGPRAPKRPFGSRALERSIFSRKSALDQFFRSASLRRLRRSCVYVCLVRSLCSARTAASDHIFRQARADGVTKLHAQIWINCPCPPHD